jgi:hypothetical protein
MNDQELKNTCNRCGKVWYLDAGELRDLENRLGVARKAMGQQHKIGMITTLFDPMLAAQMGTSSMAGLRPLQRLQDELIEKSRCPECHSKNVERVLVNADENISGEKVVKKKHRQKSSSLKVQELREALTLFEDGAITKDEYEKIKKEIIG